MITVSRIGSLYWENIFYVMDYITHSFAEESEIFTELNRFPIIIALTAPTKKPTRKCERSRVNSVVFSLSAGNIVQLFVFMAGEMGYRTGEMRP